MDVAHTHYDSPYASLFQSVLDHTELGVAVVDPRGRAVYMNASAQHLLGSPSGALPVWAAVPLAQLLGQLRGSGSHVVAKWTNDELILRVRARPLDRGAQLSVLELTVAHRGTSREVAEALAAGLQLTITDAKLLGLLWRGMSNEEIGQALNVRLGTVKSRLFRLYQKLGVKRRAAAVLRAAEILG